jgi:hypothetical protein
MLQAADVFARNSLAWAAGGDVFRRAKIAMQSQSASGRLSVLDCDAGPSPNSVVATSRYGHLAGFPWQHECRTNGNAG